MGSILSEDLGILGITGGEDCTGTAGTRVSGCRDKGGMVKRADGAALSGVVAEGEGVGEEGRGEGFIVDGISARTIRVLNRDGQCIIYIERSEVWMCDQTSSIILVGVFVLEGCCEGSAEGDSVGTKVVGARVGLLVIGCLVGFGVGFFFGIGVGCAVGLLVGMEVGRLDGLDDGFGEGLLVGTGEGFRVGRGDGLEVGREVGTVCIHL